MQSFTLSLSDYLILRAAAQNMQDRQERLLFDLAGEKRKPIIDNIINLDLAISRCNRRECSFTAVECALLTKALELYQDVLPQSSNAHGMIPSLFSMLSMLLEETQAEEGIYLIQA